MKNMGDGRRVGRVEKEVQQTIAQFLIRGFKLPLPGLVTVAQVRMPTDLRTAKVYVSVLMPTGDGTPKEEQEKQEEVVDLLQERAFEIQDYLGRELKMRYCPKLTFYLDHTTEHVLKIEKIIHDMNPPKKEDNQNDE